MSIYNHYLNQKIKKEQDLQEKVHRFVVFKI